MRTSQMHVTNNELSEQTSKQAIAHMVFECSIDMLIRGFTT
jgi:hypothetical protein